MRRSQPQFVLRMQFSFVLLFYHVAAGAYKHVVFSLSISFHEEEIEVGGICFFHNTRGN